MRTVTPWARSYVRSHSEAHFNCQVSINRHADWTLDGVSGELEITQGNSIYSGEARIWSSDTGSVLALGEADINTMATYVSIPWDASPVPDRDDIVTVSSCPGDPDLAGRAFRIMSVDGGGLMRATRRMQVTALSESASWERS